MRLAEALAAYREARTEREEAIAVGYDYRRVGRAVTALLAAQAGLLTQCEAELPALLAMVGAAQAASRQWAAWYKACEQEGATSEWVVGEVANVVASMAALQAAVAALEQVHEDGS